MNGYKLSGPPIGLPIYSTLFSPTVVGEIRREYPFHLAHAAGGAQGHQQAGEDLLHRHPGADRWRPHEPVLQRDPRTGAGPSRRPSTRTSRSSPTTGVDIIQLDEFVWPYGMGDWEVEASTLAVEGVGRADLGAHLLGQLLRHARATSPTRARRSSAPSCSTSAPADAPAPERAHGDLPAGAATRNIDALNYEVGRTGTGRPQAAAGQRVDQGLRGRRHRRQVHDHRDRRRGRRPDPAGASSTSRPSGSGCRPTAA